MNQPNYTTGSTFTLSQAAQTANNSLIPDDNMEALQKQVNAIYLNYLNNNNAFAGSDFATLQQIAALCPFTDGSSVWQARALISIYDSTQYQNICEQLQAPSIPGARLANTIVNSTVIPQADIFPNPSTGNISISIKGEANKLEVEICNLLGEKVTSSSFAITNYQTVKIENLSEGVYIVKLTVDGMKQINQRLVITK